MEIIEDVVIVGGGIAGLATSLGLHRLGIRSLVLESAECLRTSGFALAMWGNGWRAADALGIEDILRAKYTNLRGIRTTSINSGHTTSQLSFGSMGSKDNHEFRCVNRKVLLETLESELPKGTIRYSAKVVRIEIKDNLKLIHLADGTCIKNKVLIGSDGVNSVVAKFLGLSDPVFVNRSAARGLVNYEQGHGFQKIFMLFFGNMVRFGILPCDDHSLYWFFMFHPSPQGGVDEKVMEQDLTHLKQLIMSKLGNVSVEVRELFEKTDLKDISCTPLRVRHPLELLWSNLCKDNICLTGDALHPMTPDLGQGACSALEDSVVLARFLGKAMKGEKKDEKNEAHEIQNVLEKFSKERRWRSFELSSMSYLVGWIQQGDGVVTNFMWDKIIAKSLVRTMLNKSLYDCGKLTPD